MSRKLTRVPEPDADRPPVSLVQGKPTDPNAPAPVVVREIPIEQIQFDPNNLRRHNARNIGLIADTINSVGTGRSIVVNEDNQLLAGEGATTAAIQAGIRRVVLIEQPGDVLVAVKRTNLTPEQQEELAVADNRASDLSDFDPARLVALARREDAPLRRLFSPEEIDNEEARALLEASANNQEDETEPTKTASKKRLLAFRLEFSSATQKKQFEKIRTFIKNGYSEYDTEEADWFIAFFEAEYPGVLEDKE